MKAAPIVGLMVLGLISGSARADLAILPIPSVDDVYPPIPSWAGLRILHIGDSHVGNPGLTDTLRTYFESRQGSYRAIHWVGSRSQTWLTSGRLRETLDEEKPDIVIVTLDTNALRMPNPRGYSTWIRGVIARIGPRQCYWISPPPLIEDEFGLYEEMERSMGSCHLFDSRTLALAPHRSGVFHLTVDQARDWAERIWHWMNQPSIRTGRNMAFNSIAYAALFLTAFAGFWLLADRRRERNFFLLAVSYFFYGSWSPRYLLLIVFSATLDYFISRAMSRTEVNRRRRLLLAASICTNMGILATFKYFNFFAEEFSHLLGVFGIPATPMILKVALPVGISFYTFQTMSYIIDVYRRELSAADSWYEYLLFVAFFPQLVAGPIVRASSLLPQFGRRPHLDEVAGCGAIFLIGTGLFKKIAIADTLGAHLVDPVFSAPHMYSSAEALVATWAYAFQIYADFSAYSDIAIGSAALLGFQIPINFNAPYTATNLRDFWQRWHISLSTWLRDYLYIPLGGSRKGPIRTYVALIVTMLLGGLWHGAELKFVFWGAIHGGALVLTRLAQRHLPLNRIPEFPARIAGAFLTFHVVCAAWIFFRASSFENAFAMFDAIFSFTPGVANLLKPTTAVLFFALLIHWMPAPTLTRIRDGFSRIPAWGQAFLLVAIITTAHYLARTEVAPFIYFQF